MPCEVVLTASNKMLILCLLTCGAYLVIFKMDTMYTRVLHCDVCVVMKWFILVIMLWLSFVVAVPVNQLRASPRKCYVRQCLQVLKLYFKCLGF